MSQKDSSATVLAMTLGVTCAGVFLPKLYDLPRDGVNAVELEDVRLGETVIALLLLSTGAMVAYNERNPTAFFAAGVVAFVIVALYEHRIGGYSVA